MKKKKSNKNKPVTFLKKLGIRIPTAPGSFIFISKKRYSRKRNKKIIEKNLNNE